MKKILSLSIIFALLQNSSYAASVVQKDGPILNYQVTATKLDNSRNKLSAKTGQSSYSFNQETINNLPQAQTSSLNQVLLRAPGVTQNSFGQIHIRGDHSNVQYRINDVIIPQGISGFGNSFDTHFADSIDLLRGVLPAQYGFNTAGVVDIKTKGQKFEKESRSELTLGGNSTIGYNQQVSGFKDRLNYYLNATYLQNNRGIEPPTANRKSIHNDTKQDKLFGYFSYLVDTQKKLSLILANSTNRFQIPNRFGVDPLYEKNDVFLSSENINSNQKESNRYAILALQGITENDVDYQLSAFSHYTQNQYRGDKIGDLTYGGIASDINRKAFSNGLQGDFGYKINEKNTLRSGFFTSYERTNNNKNSQAFLLEETSDDHGHDHHEIHHTQDIVNITDDNKSSNQLYGLYLQDELKATEKLTLNLGLRFDAIKGIVNANQLSPRIGATYDASNKTKIYGGYARYLSAAKTTNISNLNTASYIDTTARPEVMANDRIRAERSNYYDIGISHKLTPNLGFNIDTYYKQSRNLLDEHQYGNSLIYSPFNYDRAKAYGIELGMDYKKNDLSAFINFAAQKSKAKKIISSQYIVHEEDIDIAQNNYINLDHDQSYSSSFGVNYLFKTINYGLDGIYGSGLRSGEGNFNTVASYIQINGSASRDFDLPIIKKTNLRLTMLNIFDDVYQLHDGTGIGVKAPQYGIRRTLYVILSKSF